MSRKLQKCSSKNMRWNWMRVSLYADQRPKQNHKDENLLVRPQEQNLVEKEFGPRLNQENIQSPIMQCRRNWFIFFVMEECIAKMMERSNSGESKMIFENKKHGVRRRNEEKTTVLYWFIRSNLVLPSSPRSFKTQSHWYFITGKSIIPIDFFEYICHIGCAINLHSIMNSGLILGGQNLSKKTDSILHACGFYEQRTQRSWYSRFVSTASCTILHKAWKKHQNAVCWVDINLALKKGLKFHQTRSNAVILHETLPACDVPKEVLHETVHASPQPPPKITLKHDWMKGLGSEVAQRPDGQVVQQLKSSQLNHPNPNPDHDRTGQPPLSEATQGPRKVEEKRPVPRRSKYVLSWRSCKIWENVDTRYRP